MQLYVCSSCGGQRFYVCFTPCEVRLRCLSCFKLNVIPLSSLIVGQLPTAKARGLEGSRKPIGERRRKG